MKPTHNLSQNLVIAWTMCCLMMATWMAQGQETAPTLNSNNTYHNQLFFNRFLVNPTFSLVRENKSYLNILHRNQYATFEDNSQNYFIGFSNKLNETTALGIGVYSQWSGVVQEFGFNANFAKSVRLGDKSKLTFGTNVSYFNVGLDKNRVTTTENDPEISRSKKESKIAIQPGITLSLGKFDVGLYAEDLLKYNQTTNSLQANLSDRNLKGSLQYTHTFNANRGLFEAARLMPLVQVGRNQDNSLSYVAAVLLDLPSYGWLQTTIDETYGMSMGVGFNINKKLSLGYLLEKDVLNENTDLGWNHELSLAYTFKNDDDKESLFADASQDQKIDRIVRNYEEQILNLTAELNKQKENKSIKNEKPSKKARRTVQLSAADANSLAYENKMILDELILRQDSIESARALAFEKRFETMTRLLRNDIKQGMNNNATKNGEATHAELASVDANKQKSQAVKAPKRPYINNVLPARTEVKNKALATHTPAPKVNTLAAPVKSTATNNVVATSTLATKTAIKKDILPIATKAIPKTETTTVAAATTTSKYKEIPIRLLNQKDLIGVNKGYYVIANVYKTKKYMTAFIADLKSQGINANKFFNKENGLYYVYIADYNLKSDAENATASNLGGKYQKEKWIMQVDNTTAVANLTFDD